MTQETYDMFALRQIVMVDGWKAVFWLRDHHDTLPIQALGLGTRYTYARDSDTLWAVGGISAALSYTPEETWEIFGLEYSLSAGWTVVQDSHMFCGLLPPGRSLHEWEVDGHCVDRHLKVSTSKQGPADGAL